MSQSTKPRMDDKVKEALIIAHKSLPPRLNVAKAELKEETITRSAEVTSHCWAEMLLTKDQFIFFNISTLDGAWKITPSAWDKDKHLGYLDAEVAKTVHYDPDLVIPSAWELVDDFKSRKQHPFVGWSNQ